MLGLASEAKLEESITARANTKPHLAGFVVDRTIWE